VVKQASRRRGQHAAMRMAAVGDVNVVNFQPYRKKKYIMSVRKLGKLSSRTDVRDLLINVCSLHRFLLSVEMTIREVFGQTLFRTDTISDRHYFGQTLYSIKLTDLFGL
jgi:hypothetical protein